jgi:drug/metabolite transporter superfamily protein YnfA
VTLPQNTERLRCKGVAIIGLLIVNSIGCDSHPELETAQRFQEAESAFSLAGSEDEFSRVAGQYNELLAEGFISGVVLYNQGNAWMRAGKTGRAIASWRQAQRYRPRDPYLRANLQSAITACDSQASVIPKTGIAGYVLFWQNWLSYPEKFLLSTILLVATLTAAILGTLVSQRHVGRRLALVFGFLFVVIALSAAWDWQRYDQTIYGVVIQGSVEARKGNSESYENAFTEPLMEGAEFMVLEERAGWLNIHITNLGTAWISARAAVTY